MPPEPVPFGRKDFVLRERKHDRGGPSDVLGGSDGGSFSASSSFPIPRWRDRDHSPSPRCPTFGHYKQVFPDEPSSHALTPSDPEGESFRSYYGRNGSSSDRNVNGREDPLYFKRSPWNSGDSPRQHHDSVTISSLRSVADPLTSASSSLLASLKDLHDKNDGGVNDGPGTGSGDERNRDHSLGPITWKPLKWSRSGSFSSSSAKPVRSVSDGGRMESSVLPSKSSPLPSLMTTSPPLDDGSARKKQRLGWGQGLAKYEKQKIEGPEDSSGKNVAVQSGSGSKVAFSDPNPMLTSLAGCASPATPSSVTCNNSRATIEGKTDLSTANNDIISLKDSPGFESKGNRDDFSNELEHINVDSLGCVNSLLADLLQPEEACSGDSTFMRQTTLNKLLLLKIDVLKVLEKTEGEIDSLENKLKNIDVETEEALVEASQSHVSTVSQMDSNTCSSNAPNVFAPTLNPASLEPLGHNNFIYNVQCEATEHLVDNIVIISTQFCDSSLTEQGFVDSDLAKFGGSPVNYGIMCEDGVTKCVSLVDHMEEDKSIDIYLGNVQSDTSIASEIGIHGDIECGLVSQIVASNRESSRKASQVFDKCFASTLPPIDGEYSNKSVDLKIKKKLEAHKRLLKFKERALTLKFKAFYLLWKEDLRLLSIMKRRTKSQKRCELNCRSSYNTFQKHRSSSRSQFPLPGNLTLIPTKEIVDFTTKLLSDSTCKIHRNYLKMPALLLDERERRHSTFITNNGLVEDPFLVEREKALINPWTTEEKSIFLDMLGTFGKDFRKVSSFLEHKTTADCVEYYYKNHKSESFETVKKKLKLRKECQSLPSNNYMMPSVNKWKHEPRAALLDMLGAASAIISQSNCSRIPQKISGRSVLGNPQNSCTRTSTAETAAADVLAGIGNSISSEGMGSCITSSVDLGEKMEFLQVDWPFFSEVTQTIDEEDTCSDDGFNELESVDWTDEEKSIFIRALGLYGRDFTMISRCVGTRSKEQCKIFFSKARKCLALDVICQGVSANDGEIPSSDANGGRSDTDDACLAEMNSTICSNQSCSKMDDITQSTMKNSNHDFPLQNNCSAQFEVVVSGHNGAGTELVKLTSDFINSEKKEKIQIGGAYHLESRQEMLGTFYMNAGFQKSFDNEIKIENNVLTLSVLSPPQEQLVKAEPHLDEDPQHAIADVCVPCGGSEIKLKPLQFVEPVIVSDNSQNTNWCTEANKNSLCQLQPRFDANGDTCQQETTGSCFGSVIFAPNHHNQVLLNLRPHSQKTPIFPWKQKDKCSSLSVKPESPDRPPADFDGHLHLAKQPVLGFEEHKKKQHQYFQGKNINDQCLLGNQLSAQCNQPLHVLRGYPLHMLNRNRMTADAINFDRKHAAPRNLPRKNENMDPVFQFVSRLHSEKHNYKKHNDLDTVSLPVPQCSDPLDAQLKPCSQGIATEAGEQSTRTGDIKLFGKILSHPSVLPKSQDSGDNIPSPKNSRSQSSNAPSDAVFDQSQSAGSSYMRFEEFPMRTYGFWDGKRIQTGLSSLPESAIVVSNYPGGVQKITFPTKENAGCNGLPVHQRSFSLDGEWQDISPERQGRKGMSRMAGGNSLLGVGCTDVSDPVTAIKMHYASQAGLLRKEEETWRGDIGDR